MKCEVSTPFGPMNLEFRLSVTNPWPTPQPCCSPLTPLAPILIFQLQRRGVGVVVPALLLSTRSLLWCYSGNVAFSTHLPSPEHTMNTPPIDDEPAWNPHMLEPVEHVQTRGQSPTSSESPDRRHSSSASSSTLTSGSYRESSGLRGRRMKPSVTASSSQLPAVREMKEQSEKHTNTFLSGSTEVFSSYSGKSSVASKVIPEEKIPSTKKALQVFSKVVSRNVEKEEARRKQLEKCDQEVQAQRDIYRRLVKWEARKHRGWTDYLLSWVVDHFRESPEPDVEELKSLARHYYPPRAEVKCHICDFGEGRAEHRLVELGRIEEFFNVKPDWADVRWIHAPLGFGLMHSSVEDTFLHEGEQGRPFESAGRSGFPYLMTEILNFRHRDNFQEMRDVYLLLRDRFDLLDDLNESTWKADRNPSLHHDVQWRAGHLAQEPNYWNLVSSDM
ncbi:MAG: hypothetical protein Q9214_006241 [Letrouitia sp. 1 TL-2023]